MAMALGAIAVGALGGGRTWGGVELGRAGEAGADAHAGRGDGALERRVRARPGGVVRGEQRGKVAPRREREPLVPVHLKGRDVSS
jgi:hypothetical protein